MADLVTLSDLKTYLGDAPASSDDALLTLILNDVEALYEAATLRPPGFYTAGASGRTEVLDGTGSPRLYLAFPISAVTSIKLGYDPASPSETLAVASKSVVVYGVGSRIITRTDGGVFGTVRQARYVQVVYDHLGNLPEDAKLPIMEVAASAYRNRGSEGMKSETFGTFYSYTRDDAQAAAANNALWQISVINNSPVVMA
jgi:hypothetical protein